MIAGITKLIEAGPDPMDAIIHYAGHPALKSQLEAEERKLRFLPKRQTWMR